MVTMVNMSKSEKIGDGKSKDPLSSRDESPYSSIDRLLYVIYDDEMIFFSPFFLKYCLRFETPRRNNR